MCYFLEYNACAHFNSTTQCNLRDYSAAIDYVKNKQGSYLTRTALALFWGGKKKPMSEHLLY